MSALVPARLLEGVRTKRDEQIERFIRDNPGRYKKLPAVPIEGDPAAEVHENFDRVQIGETFGAYRRKKHVGSGEGKSPAARGRRRL